MRRHTLKIVALAPLAWTGATLLTFGLLAAGGALLSRGLAAEGDTLSYGMLAAVLLTGGAWLVIRGRLAKSDRAPLVAALRRDDPEPWRYVSRWSDGKVRDSGYILIGREAGGALVANVVAWMLILMIVVDGRPPGLPGVALWLLPIGGAVMAIVALRDVRHRLRFGGATFKMDAFPAMPGGAVAGTVWYRAGRDTVGGTPFTVSLTSLRRRETLLSHGRNDRIQLHQLSHQHHTAAAQICERNGRRYVGIRVAFAIPRSAEPATLHDPYNRVLWCLTVDSDPPAAPFRAQFEVPVFDTGVAVVP